MNTSDDKTLFIVSGFMRTGTSMMMKALEAGGMQTEYKKEGDINKERYSDSFYDPNLGGLYELTKKEYLDNYFPRNYEGKLIKCLIGGLTHMRVMPRIRLVIMKREYEEIRQSFFAFFGKKLGITKEELDSLYEEIRKTLDNRKDCDFVEFDYREVVKDPRKYFQILKDIGWPIDVESCIKIVDPLQVRYKLESLERGII